MAAPVAAGRTAVAPAVLPPFFVIQLAAVGPQQLMDCSDSKLKRTLPTPPC